MNLSRSTAVWVVGLLPMVVLLNYYSILLYSGLSPAWEQFYRIVWWDGMVVAEWFSLHVVVEILLDTKSGSTDPWSQVDRVVDWFKFAILPLFGTLLLYLKLILLCMVLSAFFRKTNSRD